LCIAGTCMAAKKIRSKIRLNKERDRNVLACRKHSCMAAEGNVLQHSCLIDSLLQWCEYTVFFSEGKTARLPGII
jgi:hypothetical protein